MPTTTGKRASTRPAFRTSARRSARWITIAHGVTTVIPTSAGTQPLVPFGRAGTPTRSHLPPAGPFASRMIGMTVLACVSGVRISTLAIAGAPGDGAERTITALRRTSKRCKPTPARPVDGAAEDRLPEAAITVTAARATANIRQIMRRLYLPRRHSDIPISQPAIPPSRAAEDPKVAGEGGWGTNSVRGRIRGRASRAAPRDAAQRGDLPLDECFSARS